MMQQEKASAVKLAHIAEDGRGQSILEHLMGTARLAADFARPFGAQAQAELAGLAHDIGKYSDAFQRRLHGGPRVDHATAGAAECCARGQIFAAFAVAGHHGGLPDGGSVTDCDEASTLHGRVKRAVSGKLEPYASWSDEVTLPAPALPDFALRSNENWMFFTRMLYSCLVDADFLNTEAFMSGKARSENKPDWDEFWQKL